MNVSYEGSYISARMDRFFSSKSSAVMTPASRSSLSFRKRSPGSPEVVAAGGAGAAGVGIGSVMRWRMYSAISFAHSLTIDLISALFPEEKIVISPKTMCVECCTDEMWLYAKSSKRLLPMPAE